MLLLARSYFFSPGIAGGCLWCYQRKNSADKVCGVLLYLEQRELIELLLVLTGSFRLLLTLQAGAHVMLSALNFLNNAGLGAGTLESLQSGFQRFIFFNMNFRHG